VELRSVDAVGRNLNGIFRLAPISQMLGDVDQAHRFRSGQVVLDRLALTKGGSAGV
jgi:hypothetical protein